MTLKVDTIRHHSASVDALTFDSSGNTTIEGNTTVDGTSTLTGNVTCSGQLKTAGIRNASASSDAITFATDGTCTAKITNNLSNRNVIVNGGCLVAQRGASSTSTGYGSVDRMEMVTANTDNIAFLQKQTSDGPDGFSKCWEFDVTTTETTLDADEIVYMRYKAEAQDLRPFYNANGTGKNFTLSFWVKAKQTGTYQVSIHKADNTTRFISTTYTIAAADTWQKVVWNVTGDTGTSGINADNGQGFQIAWQLAAGTNYTSGGVQSSWGSFANSVMAGGHAVNVADNTANYWRITGIQLEVGDVATDFEHRSYGDELAKCQRYFYMHANGSESAAGSGGSGLCPIMSGGWYNGSAFTGVIQFPTRMRTGPSIYKVEGTDYFSVLSNNAIDTNDSVSMNRVSTTTASLWLEGNASGTQGHGGYARTHSSSARIGFNAEL